MLARCRGSCRSSGHRSVGDLLPILFVDVLLTVDGARRDLIVLSKIRSFAKRCIVVVRVSVDVGVYRSPNEMEGTIFCGGMSTL